MSNDKMPPIELCENLEDAYHKYQTLLEEFETYIPTVEDDADKRSSMLDKLGRYGLGFVFADILSIRTDVAKRRLRARANYKTAR